MTTRSNVVTLRPQRRNLHQQVRAAIAASVFEQHKRACRSLSRIAVELDREMVDLPRGPSR